MHYLIEEGYIPFDKSWIIRLGVLDLLNNKNTIDEFLDNNQQKLSDDLLSLQTAIQDWRNNEPIRVGESGTLCRFLKFAAWARGEEREFVKKGTLIERDLYKPTSQWQSAAYLCGAIDKQPTDHPKIQLTYDAVDHWNETKETAWTPRYDNTILQQAITFLDRHFNCPATFSPESSEDYCFARTFGYIFRPDAEKQWPELADHESNRFVEMDKAIKQVRSEQTITSPDHRVVQAAVMHQVLTGYPINVTNKDAVNKSWPQFWSFIENLYNFKDRVKANAYVKNPYIK